MADSPAPVLDDPTDVGSYFVATYPPFSVWTTEAVQATPCRLCRPRPGRACRSASTCTSRSAASAVTSATSGCTPTRTPRKSARISTCWRASGSCTRACRSLPSGPSTSCTSAAARRRFCRRSQLEGLVNRLTAATPWRDAAEVTFECEPGTLTEAKLSRDPPARRDAAQPGRRELQRRDPHRQRARPSFARGVPRVRVRAVARLPADQHRPDRRHAGRDRRELARLRRQDAGAPARQRHHLPDGAAASTRRSAATC